MPRGRSAAGPRKSAWRSARRRREPRTKRSPPPPARRCLPPRPACRAATACHAARPTRRRRRGRGEAEKPHDARCHCLLVRVIAVRNNGMAEHLIRRTFMDIWPGNPYPLGATYDGAGVNFAIFSEVADRVELCLIDEKGAERRI